ncbi:serine/arginine repetitive matrix protein 2 [Microdochium nivale]|nr:serine/arginine repetitive matrix protein 2 [Microdochium nivale]
MISMQRSLSSPVCVQTSPPESPPSTRPSSRSPEVSPGPLDESPRTRRYRSRSPTKSTALFETHVSLPMRKANDASSQLGRQSPTKTASPIIVQKPIIEQTVLPAPYQEMRKPRLDHPRETPPAAISTAPTMAPQPLLADLSLYRNTNINLEQDGTTLVELSHLVQLSKHQERKRASTRVRLQRSLISSALSARLTKCGEITLRNLAECFRNEDKKGFASLFNAIHDVRSSCDEARSFAVLEPEMDALRSPGAASSSGNPDTPVGTFGAMPAGQSVVPFLNDISASAREAFLNFLTQLRTNPDYLASRLSSLTATEIQSLTFFHKGLEPIEPVLPSYNRPGARGNAGANSRGPSNQLNAVERLLSFQRHDPLSALIYTCFANSAGPDSAEDRRRTDVWAAACARLVQNKVHHSVLTSVLNVWSTMRDWAGRSNMELYLMKILEDGAFLLDRAEDPNGTRFNLSTWTNKDNAAMEEFYDNAVDGLFEILDDEDATGIPDGVIELGNAILRRVDNKLVDEVRRWLVYQWLFTNWLFAVVIHPESYGMMAEYHITEYGRQKVLKQVAHRAQKPVLDMLMSYKAKPDPVSPKIQGHIQNILGRFRPSRTAKTARLLPARSITSLRETAEVHPYLVVSPADLLTLVNALFPERRPQSSYMSSIRSGAPSLSGFSAISQPVSIGTARSNNFDTASIASFSASSVLSDATTSRDFDQHNAGSPQRYSPPFTDLDSQRPSANYEDDGYRLRLAMHEMVQTLGAETVAGSCHPCAERWAVLFISANGSNLSLQMTYDPDEDVDEENSSTTSETEDDELDSRPELDNDYHLLRDSILKLVEDFDIPRNLTDDGSRTTLSNRASGLKRYKSKTRVVIPESSMGSRNPYRPRGSQDNPSSIKSPSPTAEEAEDELASQPVLVKMLIAASSQSRVQSDFVSAHLYWRTLQQLNALGSSSLRKNGFAALLNIFARGPRDSIRRSASATEEYDAWLIWLKQSQERHEGLLDTMMKRLRGIRDKMWYKTDVHNSQPYEDIRCHCTALKIMGVPSKWDSYKRNRAQMSRGLSANFLYQNESQTLDLLAAAEEQGGPNKLRDDQADKTSRWLESFGIENFCRGEERIHRFCCEVDTCISKLVAEQVMDSPVLWSSELFTRDRGVFGGPRIARERESYYIDDDVVSVVSGHGRRYTSSSTRAGSVARDSRSVTSFNLSQVSVDSSRHSYPRHGAAMSDILDAHEYFGLASPVHSIDPNTTYWSPFQSTMPSAASAMSTTSRAHSPTTSITNLSSAFSHPFSSAGSTHQANARPGTAASSNETVHQQRISDEKQQFLTDLRQTLTSLLLSDLGNLVFSRGSETDSWFNDLGQKCIDRDEAQEARSQRKSPRSDRSSRSSLKQRVIEKKKSFGDLRGAGESAAESTCSDRVDPGASHGSDSVKPDVHSQSSPKPRSTAAKDGTADFPYKKAYQRLFRMFSVHPNPQVKLNALFELKNLVEASLLTSGRKNKWARQQRLAAKDSHADHGSSPKVLEQTIDSIKERRSHASQPIAAHPWSSRFISASDAKSIMSVAAAPNSDAVANLLLSLFKDSQVRPRTLFRDLQFISSFVSPSVLDKSEKGRAFWDAGLAALTLKQDVCRNMVNTAYDIIDLDQQLSRKPAASSAAAAPGSKEDKVGGQSGGRLGSLTPRDAARMYSITAKEGDPMAQRELALLILSRHELVVDRATLPLAKPRDVFKQAVMDNFGGGGSGAGRSGGGSTARHVSERVRSTFSASSGGGASGGAGSNGSNASSSSASGLGGGNGGQDAGSIGDVRPDPSLMCVAFHWMETAAQGGDAQAKQFLVDNDMRRD